MIFVAVVAVVALTRFREKPADRLADRLGLRHITASPEIEAFPSLSPDGKSLAYSSNRGADHRSCRRARHLRALPGLLAHWGPRGLRAARDDLRHLDDRSARPIGFPTETGTIPTPLPIRRT
ncbi:MAG: hypothetical protein GY719_24245 [bacterium]|nr:hypothetical protein [bacterium]